LCVCVCVCVTQYQCNTYIKYSYAYTYAYAQRYTCMHVFVRRFLLSQTCSWKVRCARGRTQYTYIHIPHMFMYTFIRLHYNMHVFHIHVHVCAQDVAPPAASVGGARGTGHNIQKYIYHTHTFMRIFTYACTRTYVYTIMFIY